MKEYEEVVKNPLSLEMIAARLKMGDYYRNKESLLSDLMLMVFATLLLSDVTSHIVISCTILTVTSHFIVCD